LACSTLDRLYARWKQGGPRPCLSYYEFWTQVTTNIELMLGNFQCSILEIILVRAFKCCPVWLCKADCALFSTSNLTTGYRLKFFDALASVY